MGTDAELSEGLRDIPGTRAPPKDLVAAVNRLYEANAEMVTLEGLASLSTARSPQQTARALRERGWLLPLPVAGAWEVATGLSAPHMGAFVVLRARLLVNPATPACVGGRSAAQVRGWLRRPTASAIGYSGDSGVPRCLAGYSVCRWRPRVPLDALGGLPVWRPETLLAYMGTRPGRFPWTDIAEWLPDACEAAAPELLAAELDGRPAGAWARTAYLLHRGGQPGAAAVVAALGRWGESK